LSFGLNTMDRPAHWSGVLCTRSGTYRSGCLCGRRADVYFGFAFPSCPTCGQCVGWVPVADPAAGSSGTTHFYVLHTDPSESDPPGIERSSEA
jgi:hypothetical protein